MRLVREYINEKFIEDSDSIHDMGIGINVKRDYETHDQLFDYLAKNILTITGLKKLPRDFITLTGKPGGRVWKMMHPYSSIIRDFIEKYVTVKGKKLNMLYLYFISGIYNILNK